MLEYEEYRLELEGLTAKITGLKDSLDSGGGQAKIEEWEVEE